MRWTDMVRLRELDRLALGRFGLLRRVAIGALLCCDALQYWINEIAG